MSLSNIQRSLRSSRSFLRNLSDRLKAKSSKNKIFEKNPRNFTFDHGQFTNDKKSERMGLKWLFIIPVALLIGFGGLIIVTIIGVLLFFMHGVKMLCEGHRKTSKKFKFQKVALRPSRWSRSK